jgi:hypothetical protein
MKTREELEAIDKEMSTLDMDSAEGRRRMYELMGPLTRQDLKELNRMGERRLEEMLRER